MHSSLHSLIARRAIVTPVLILAAGAANRAGSHAGSPVFIENASLNSAAFPATEGATDLAIEMTGETTDIYRIKTDGTGLTRLTNAGGFNGYAAWSPDGAKIAFSTNRDDEGSIYVMNADGSGQARLTTGLAAWQPVWSPDGTQIAFTGFGNDLDLYVIAELSLCGCPTATSSVAPPANCSPSAPTGRAPTS
jgi:dipeptidyl aminopeptidase/acylaminoacyl peptidase